MGSELIEGARGRMGLARALDLPPGKGQSAQREEQVPYVT